MKVLLVNGSPHANGNTYLALDEMRKVFEEEGIEARILHIGNQSIRGCIACNACAGSGRFYSTHFDKTMKVGAAVAAARRGGLTSTFDELNKYFTISGMPVASGQYWNGVHGLGMGEAVQDKEGLQQMRTLAKNMAFLMKSIQLGKQQYGLPEREESLYTNFVR